ncbi:Putrescine aminotransferase [Symmachiella dynata]|uniref:Putrescine aminotransferase n=1 Tax=Symmachiella dynata TaxID=2527995 RepID=A0A517ZXB2_9PLAN|nr:aspartate aminotransferase family protein [Symmachiella dynata]QDU47129.1 Putrescine aminotransferase [Symmachiella dynata]
MNTPNDDHLRTEGDVNFSAVRQEWQAGHLNEKTRSILDADARAFLHQSLSTPCLNALEGCEGIYLIDSAGRRIMDFHGNSAHQVGYGHPRVVQAVKDQLDQLPFCPRRYTNEPSIQLADKLAEMAPGDLSKVLFAPAGTAAIGIALKLARYATRRHKTISMWGSFHGASLDAISVGGEALFRDGLGPLLPGSLHVPWPHEEQDAAEIERLMDQEGDIGAVIAEPMRCTTVDAPSAAYWRRVRTLCDAHGALLIFDEIPLGLGRTGRFFCCEHFGVTPDVLVIGKGLGGGVMPLAATIARADLDIAPDRALGHYTHEKSPLAAAAALATIDVIEQENLVARAHALGQHAASRLRHLQQQVPLISDVRVLGLAIGVELSRGGGKANAEAERAMYECLTRGLSFKVSDGNVLTLMPPLVISKAELDAALDIVGEVLRAL